MGVDSVKQQNQVGQTGAKDTTPPPQPQVQLAVAYVPIAREEMPAQQPTAGAGGAGRDPAYIQLANIEAGTNIEFINLSKNPAADFAKDAAGLKLMPTDVFNRRAGIHLDDEMLKKLDLKPGDVLAIRAVDDAGNASPPTQLRLDPNQWAGGPGRANRIQMMQDAFTDKVAFARGVTDTRPPTLDGNKLGLKVHPSNSQYFVLTANKAVEPFAQVQILNPRVQQQPFAFSVDANGNLPNAAFLAQAGDTLRITAIDSSGVRGQEITAAVDPAQPNGFRLVDAGQAGPARPATPQLRMAVAYDAIPRDTVQAQARPPERRDPLYIELGNVDPGHSLELINVSRDPGAKFGEKNSAFKFSAEDPIGRRASIKFDEKQLAAVDYHPGDVLKVRIADGKGQFSDPLVVPTDPNAWAGGPNRQGSITMMNDRFSDVVAYARSTTDDRPPLVKREAVSLAKVNDQVAMLKGQGAIEPGASAQVINTRTGQVVNVAADPNGDFNVQIAAAPGDTLVMRPFDRNALRGEDVPLKYSGG